MRVVVTGGTGFVGSHLIKALIGGPSPKLGADDIVCVSRRPSQDLSRLRVRHVACDFGTSDCDSPSGQPAIQDALARACEGADLVFHIAAKVAMWGARDDFYRANVIATEKLVSIAQAAGVRRFVYTSSPSVIADGTDLSGVDESYPYPKHFEAFYPETKAKAEQLVLAAHRDDFRTVALRPHLIFGPHDTNLVPTIIKKARAGRLAIIGAGNNRVDFSFIDDCVQAHLRAAEMLAGPQGKQCGGRPYFISQGEPMVLWDFVNKILTGIGEPPVTKRVSRPVAAFAAGCMEFMARMTGREPALTKFLISEMATEHFFDISAARRNLDYAPTVSMEEGIARTIQWLKQI